MGEHYQNALRFQEEGRWRDALAELKQGAEEEDGMCCWWLCESKRFYWGVRSVDEEQGEWNIKGEASMCPRHLAERLSHRSPKENWVSFGAAIVKSDDDYAKATYHKNFVVHDYDSSLDSESLESEPSDVLFYYHRSALSGDCFGMYQYALMKKGEQRLHYLTLAAKKGFCEAQNKLGCLLWKGDDPEQALYWLRKAAAQEHQQSQQKLLDIYLGPIAPCRKKFRNIAAAYYWLRKIRDSIRPELRLFCTQINALEDLEIMKQDFQRIERCQESSRMLMGIRCHRVDSPLSILPKDVVKLIAKALWLTRDDDDWGDDAAEGVVVNKKIKI